MSTEEMEATAIEAVHRAEEYTQRFMDGGLVVAEDGSKASETDVIQQISTIADLWKQAADNQVQDYVWHSGTLGDLISELVWLNEGSGEDRRYTYIPRQEVSEEDRKLYSELFEIINDAQPDPKDFDFEVREALITLRLPRWVMNTACEITGFDPDGHIPWDDPEPYDDEEEATPVVGRTYR